MPRINTSKTNHTPPRASATWKYNKFTASEKRQHATLIRAMRIIENRIKGYKPCEKAFEALPGGKSFAEIWKDPDVWLHYDPEFKKGKYGARRRGTKDITISAYAFRGGDHWTVAATLIHELAHVNGAPGNDTQAEDTLKSCLLHKLHDPTIIGQVGQPTQRKQAYA